MLLSYQILSCLLNTFIFFVLVKEVFKTEKVRRNLVSEINKINEILAELKPEKSKEAFKIIQGGKEEKTPEEPAS